MKPFSIVLLLCLLLAAAIGALSPAPLMLAADPSAWAWRRQAINLTGVLAILLMTAGVALAQRPAWLDRRIGLDAVYRLHRHVGIAAGVAALLHWLLRQVPRWLVEAGLVTNPGDLARGDYPKLVVVLYRVGLLLVEYAFYASAALLLIALLRRVPYRTFRASHRLLALAVVPIAFHAATAPLRDHWYAEPAGWMTLGVALACAALAARALAGRMGRARRAQGVIASVAVQGASTCVEVALNNPPFSHRAGQFVMLRCAHDAEHHPFTISGQSEDGRTLQFRIKGLGDYTRRLPDQLRIGDAVEIEGPYGVFDFRDTAARQVWVAGGVGITPFLRRLEALARGEEHSGGPAISIDLWYCTRTEAEGLWPDNLEALCRRAGARLHRMTETRHGRLSAAQLHAVMQDLDGASIWFCGPEPFGKALRRGLQALSFNVGQHFHQEAFRFR